MSFKSEDGGLALVKLHGSVTWYQDIRGGIERIEHLTPLNPLGKEVKRLVILPTRFKDIYAQNYFSLYSQFLSTLGGAQVLIVIGHSLRDEYLRAAIVERFRYKGFRLVIISPKMPSALGREIGPQGPIPEDAVTLVPLHIEEFAHDLARILAKEGAKDVPSECKDIWGHIKRSPAKLQIRGRIGSLQAGELCAFTTKLRIYVPPEHQPARLRVWVSADYDHPEKGKQRTVSADFLEHQLAEAELRGYLDTEYAIEVQIPDYSVWRKCAGRAELHVAVLTNTPKKPSSHGRASHTLAEATRELSYR